MSDLDELIAKQERLRAELFNSSVQWLIWKPVIPWPRWLAKRWGHWVLPEKKP